MTVAPFWAAFNELTTERQVGMSLGSIPSSFIWAYADRNGLDGDEADHLHAIIRKVDVGYLSINSPKTDTEDGKMRRIARMDDPDGLRGLFGGLEAKGKKKKK